MWKVVQGSGMGLCHSGDVMDFAFWQRCESKLLADKVKLLHTFGIYRYWRYRDDILIVAISACKARTFVDEVAAAGGHFKISVEEFGSSTARYLDLELTVAGTNIVTRPAWKPTSLLRPLETSSAHPPSVHVSWPVSMMQNAAKLASSEGGAEAAQQFLLQGFQRFLTPQPILDSMESAIVLMPSAKVRDNSPAVHTNNPNYIANCHRCY